VWVVDLIEALLDQVARASKERRKLRAARARGDSSAVLESRARITSMWIVFGLVFVALATFIVIEYLTTQ
jgi:uncharacterized membrane protein